MKPENAVPSRMSVQLRRALITIGLVAALLSVLVAAILFHRAFAAQVDQDLARTAQAVAAACQALAETDPDSLDSYLDNTSLRLTLIDPDGNVVYDSEHRNESDMDNHLSRPEIADAIAQGEGRSVRRSETIGRETHYYALRLANGQILRLGEETAGIWSVYNEVLPALAVAGVLVVALAALLAAVFTRRLVQPIIRMAEHLDTIEANVPYEELIPLARTIQSDRRLREDNENMRREFTANVSHELKTPLTSISGFAELLESGMTKPQDAQLFGQRIHREAKRMIRLVSDILQLSELDGMHGENAAPLEKTPLSLGALVRDVAGTMTMNAKKAYITLQHEEAPATVLGNRDLLTELITNLCDNAIRYNRPDGHVILRCGTENGMPFLSVEDNGIGIPQDAQSRVFERFYRVDKSRSKATGGTGLGLAIVKHIVMLHDAKLDLKSTVGTGTTIRVTCPPVEPPAENS